MTDHTLKEAMPNALAHTPGDAGGPGPKTRASHPKEHPQLFRGDMVRAILAGQKTQTRRIPSPRNTLLNGGPWPKWAREAVWDWSSAWVDGGDDPYLHLPFLSHPDPEWHSTWEGTSHRIYPRVEAGDQLWVRETWYCDHCFVGDYDLSTNAGRVGPDAEPDRDACHAEWREHLEYRATHVCAHWEGGCPCSDDEGRSCWRPSIFMPRWASRITLPVTRVRIERVQEISEEDAMAEGIRRYTYGEEYGPEHLSHVYGTERLSLGAMNVTASDAFARLWDDINDSRGWAWAVNSPVLVYEWEPHHG